MDIGCRLPFLLSKGRPQWQAGLTEHRVEQRQSGHLPILISKRSLGLCHGRQTMEEHSVSVPNCRLSRLKYGTVCVDEMRYIRFDEAITFSVKSVVIHEEGR